MARDTAFKRRHERTSERERTSRRSAALDEVTEVVRAHRGDARELGARLEHLMDTRGFQETERGAAWRAVEEAAGHETAQQAFTGASRRGGRPGVMDADGVRAAATQRLLESLTTGLGLGRDAVTVDTTEHAGAVTGGRGARGLSVGNTVYLDPGRYDPATRDGKALLAHEVVHVAQRAVVTPGVGPGPETEARVLSQRFAGQGAVSAPVSALAPTALAADVGTDEEHEGTAAQGQEEDKKPEPVDPPEGLALAPDASEEQVQDANQAQGLDPQAHLPAADPPAPPGGPQTQGVGPDQQLTQPKNGKATPEPVKGQGEPAQEGGETEGQETQEEQNTTPAPKDLPGAAPPPPPPPMGAPAIPPVQFGIAPADQARGHVIEDRPGGMVVFVPNDPADLDRKPATGDGTATPVVRSLGADETQGIKDQRRQQAAASVAAFTSAGEAKAASLDQFRTSSVGQLAQAATESSGRIATALSQNTQALRTAFDGARRQVVRNAGIATARVRASAQTAKDTVAAETTTRKAAIEAAARTAAEEIARMDTALRGQVSQAFQTSGRNITGIGTEKGAAAVAQGRQAATRYTNPRAPDGGFFEGDEYNRNKQRARAGAANDVAAAYRDEFIRKATETAAAVVAAEADVTKGLTDRIKAATDQITASKNGAIRQVESSATAANTAIDRALESAVTSIATQSQTQQATLRTSERTQTKTLSDNATAAAQQVAEQSSALTRTVEEQLTQAAGQIRTQVQGVSGMGAGADFPDVDGLNQALSATLGELDGAVTSIQTSVGQSVSGQVSAMGEHATGLEASFQELLKQGSEQAAGISTSFASSTRELATLTSTGMTEAATGHTTRGTEILRTATTSIDGAKTSLQTDFTNIQTNLATSLTKTETDFRAGLDASLRDMAGTISSKAEEAAKKVQPAWKTVLKIIINIIAAIVVAIVVAALVASGVGLLAGLLIAGLVGAAVAVAKQAACDLVDGEMSSWQTYVGEAIGGAIGGVVAFATAGVGSGWGASVATAVTGRIANVAVQSAVKVAVKITFDATLAGVTEVVSEVIKRAIDPEKDITWGAIGSAFLGGFVGGGVSSGMGSMRVNAQGLRPTQVVDRAVIKATQPATEAVMRALQPLAGQPMTQAIMGQGVRAVGRSVVDNAASETGKQLTGTAVNAQGSDQQRANQQGGAKDARASLDRNVPLPRITADASTPAPALQP